MRPASRLFFARFQRGAESLSATSTGNRKIVLTAVLIQAVVTLLAGAVAWLVWGPLHAVSLVAGGGSIVIPNALLALRLKASRPEFAPVVLLVGEFVKIGFSVLLLWASYRMIDGLSWGALIVGVILALKSLFLAPWIQSRIDQHSVVTPNQCG